MKTRYTGTLRILHIIVQSAGVVVGISVGELLGLGIAALIAHAAGALH